MTSIITMDGRVKRKSRERSNRSESWIVIFGLFADGQGLHFLLKVVCGPADEGVSASRCSCVSRRKARSSACMMGATLVWI